MAETAFDAKQYDQKMTELCAPSDLCSSGGWADLPGRFEAASRFAGLHGALGGAAGRLGGAVGPAKHRPPLGRFRRLFV